MRVKLLLFVAAMSCFAGLAAKARADIVIIHSDGSHEVISSPINAIVTIDSKGNMTTTYPPPKPSNTAN